MHLYSGCTLAEMMAKKKKRKKLGGRGQVCSVPVPGMVPYPITALVLKCPGEFRTY